MNFLLHAASCYSCIPVGAAVAGSDVVASVAGSAVVSAVAGSAVVATVVVVAGSSVVAVVVVTDTKRDLCPLAPVEVKA